MDLETAICVSYIIWYSFGLFVTCTIVVHVIKTIRQ